VNTFIGRFNSLGLVDEHGGVPDVCPPSCERQVRGHGVGACSELAAVNYRENTTP
jgi:hypothetical protein